MTAYKHTISLDQECEEVLRSDANISLSAICQNRLLEISKFRELHNADLRERDEKIKNLISEIQHLHTEKDLKDEEIEKLRGEQ